MRASTFVLDTKLVFSSQFFGVTATSSDELDWLLTDLAAVFAEELEDVELTRIWSAWT